MSDYRSSVETPEITGLKKRIQRSMALRGVLVAPMLAGSLSTPMNESHIDAFIAAFFESLEEQLNASPVQAQSSKAEVRA